MRRRLTNLLPIFLSIPLLLCPEQEKTTPVDPKGSIIGESTYHNPLLGMTIALPGAWQDFDKESQRRLGLAIDEEGDNSGCRGPLCGRPAIDVAIASKPLPPRFGVIYMNGYRLAPEYLDRKRYPLVRFAEAMTKNSLGGTDWTISSDLTAIQLDGKPAYRIIVKKPVPGGHQGWGFGYVSEANGYVFLMIGNAIDADPESPRKLQAAIENMHLGRLEPGAPAGKR